MDIKEIRKEIKRLKKLKKDLRSGSKERIEIFRKIKVFKKELADIFKPQPDKDIIIAEILKLERERKLFPTFEVLGINLGKYTVEQLKIHLKKLKLDR